MFIYKYKIFRNIADQFFLNSLKVISASSYFIFDYSIEEWIDLADPNDSLEILPSLGLGPHHYRNEYSYSFPFPILIVYYNLFISCKFLPRIGSPVFLFNISKVV
jgi:hypothetical protein